MKQWYYGCVGLSAAKESSAANYLCPAGHQLLRHISLIPPLCPKSMCDYKGVSPSLDSWGIACLLLKVSRHCWRCCCCPLKSYTLSPRNYHWERSLHDTDSLQVRLMGWVAVSAASMAEHNHKPGTFLSNVAFWLSGLFPKSSLLRRAGHSLGSYSIHCPSILPHDEQECSLLLQNIGLAFRTSVWAQYNSPFFPPLFQDHAEMQLALEDNIWSKHSPVSIFKEAQRYSLKDSSGSCSTFQPLHWSCSTHTTTRSRNMGLIEHFGLHMSMTWRDPVSVIIMMLESLNVLSSWCYRYKFFTPVSL